MSKKLIGCCSLCDKEVAEILQRYPQGHLYVGEPVRIGKFFEDARRATLILTNGSQMDITVCQNCAEELPTSLCKLWVKIVSAWKLETTDAHRVAINASAYTEKQRLEVDKWFQTASKEPPVGVLKIENWKDIPNG